MDTNNDEIKFYIRPSASDPFKETFICAKCGNEIEFGLEEFRDSYKKHHKNIQTDERLRETEQLIEIEKMINKVKAENATLRQEVGGRERMKKYINPIPTVGDNVEPASMTYTITLNFDEPVTKGEALAGINNWISENGGKIQGQWLRPGEPIIDKIV